MAAASNGGAEPDRLQEDVSQRDDNDMAAQATVHVEATGRAALRSATAGLPRGGLPGHGRTSPTGRPTPACRPPTTHPETDSTILLNNSRSAIARFTITWYAVLSIDDSGSETDDFDEGDEPEPAPPPECMACRAQMGFRRSSYYVLFEERYTGPWCCQCIIRHAYGTRQKERYAARRNTHSNTR